MPQRESAELIYMCGLTAHTYLCAQSPEHTLPYAYVHMCTHPSVHSPHVHTPTCVHTHMLFWFLPDTLLPHGQYWLASQKLAEHWSSLSSVQETESGPFEILFKIPSPDTDFKWGLFWEVPHLTLFLFSHSVPSASQSGEASPQALDFLISWNRHMIGGPAKSNLCLLVASVDTSII